MFRRWQSLQPIDKIDLRLQKGQLPFAVRHESAITSTPLLLVRRLLARLQTRHRLEKLLLRCRHKLEPIQRVPRTLLPAFLRSPTRLGCPRGLPLDGLLRRRTPSTPPRL